MKCPSSTVIEKLMRRLRDQAQRFNATLEVAPVAVLWTDERREWEGVLPNLKFSMPELFVTTKKRADLVTPAFVSAAQGALSGLEKIGVSGDDIKNALLQGGSPATPDDLRKRFRTFLNDRCKGKYTSKLRFVVE